MTPLPIRRLAAVVAFFSFIPLAVSGLVLLCLPRGGGGYGRGIGRTVEFLGVVRYDWGEIHEIAAVVFLTAAVIHLACNWKAMKRHLGLGPSRGDVARDCL